MALGDYILCCKCDIKLIYDGDRGNREWWAERFGSEPEIKCPNCEREAHVDGNDTSTERVDKKEEKRHEPVAWMHVMDNTEGIKANGKGVVSITQKRKHPFGKPGVDFSKSYPVTSTPLYTTPQPQREWVGLTDEERYELLSKADWAYDPESYAVVVEAKLKEKNNG